MGSHTAWHGRADIPPGEVADALWGMTHGSSRAMLLGEIILKRNELRPNVVPETYPYNEAPHIMGDRQSAAQERGPLDYLSDESASPSMNRDFKFGGGDAVFGTGVDNSDCRSRRCAGFANDSDVLGQFG